MSVNVIGGGGGLRIAKYIAQTGLCSRRAAEDLVNAGKVTLNGRRVDDVVTFVDVERDRIAVNGRLLTLERDIEVYLHYKRRGDLVTHVDPQGRACLLTILAKRLERPSILAVGRLDMDSEGLLLLTNSGAFSREMTLPSSGYEREYAARLYGPINARTIERLAHGVVVDGERFRPIRMQKIVESEKRADAANQWYTVTLNEGRNREVRRALASVGVQVTRLVRTRFGPFELGNLRPGDIRIASHSLVDAIAAKFANTVDANNTKSSE